MKNTKLKKRSSQRFTLFNKLFLNKKGMEMWELVIMVLAIILLIFVIAWYVSLDKSGQSLLERLGQWL
ncbi:hypothetical protein J4437_03150 [Candidatus Woesearchaeota archaeon]|nr:hypothetical protein [Candidatus Woesearchaeota archaeon]